MNQAYIHLISNHLPIVGSLFALVLLGVGLFQSNEPLSRAGLVAVLAAGVLALPAEATGEGAAALVRKLPGVSQALIERHAAAAELGFWVLEAAATLALLALLLLQNASPRFALLARLTFGTLLLGWGLLARAGSSGGQIRHSEMRDGFEQRQAAP